MYLDVAFNYVGSPAYSKNIKDYLIFLNGCSHYLTLEFKIDILWTLL